MPGPRVPAGSIYACLFSRGDGAFHWAILVPVDDDPAFGRVVYKLHATNRNENLEWRFECVHDRIEESPNACVVVKIGTCGFFLLCVVLLGTLADTTPETISTVHTLLKAIPLETPSEDQPHRFTCRIWFKEAIRVLHRNSILACPSVNRLETELRLLGEENDRVVQLGGAYKVLTSDYSQ